MITYLVKAAHTYTINRFLATWGERLASDICVRHYEDILGTGELPRGVCIFSDLERLSDEERKSASQLASTLAGSGRLVLNHPDRVLCRRELLRTFKDCGLNSFNIYGASELPGRFPVFVRQANDHKGSITNLLHSESELRDSIAELEAAGRQPRDLMIIEYLDTSDAGGLFRKYSCFLIGEFFIPRHLLFSHKWVTKKPDVVTEALAQEETLFLEGRPHPHEERIRRLFQIAGIDYGRIDYAVVGGEIQVWEINTNPMVTVAGPNLAPERYESQARVYEEICRAFESLAQLGVPKDVRAPAERLWHKIGRLASAIFT